MKINIKLLLMAVCMLHRTFIYAQKQSVVAIILEDRNTIVNVAAQETRLFKSLSESSVINNYSDRVDGKGGQMSPYNCALGLKFFWGIAATGKFCFKQNHAFEAILKYRGVGELGDAVGGTLLYEYQKAIPQVQGLHWFLGGGAFYHYTFYKNDTIPGFFPSQVENSSYGISSIVGLEYQLRKIPVAISVDWMPSFDLNGGIVRAGNGGIGIKYGF